MRLDYYLLRVFKRVPKSHVYRIIRSGEVRVNKGRAKPATRLAETDEVRLPPVRQRDRPGPVRPPDDLLMRLDAAIVQETDDYILFDKPPGLAVHAGSGLAFGLIEALRAMRPDMFVELVHRLDRQTSGCLLVAKSRAALDNLRTGLNAATSEKHYSALVDGVWRGGARQVDAPLSRDNERGGERMVAVDHDGGRAASSYFEPVETFTDATLMQARIRTGRTHQIRVHAAHCGHPVAADGKYGANARRTLWRKRGLDRMFLHAATLALWFRGTRLELQAPLAPDLQQALDGLRALR